MKIELAEHDRMTESGSSLLRLIQNQDMPILDLLIREAVQNSLDAKDPSKAFVCFDVSTVKFKAEELNKNLEGITDSLNRRFHGQEYPGLIIRDSNTVGLTGPLTYDKVKDQNFGNLLKLVYEICKPQTNEGAGGSWGLGKTVYYRLGIGLVIYYSRIKEGNKYASRLAACLVEDETKPQNLLPAPKNKLKRGIAWWGESAGRGKNTIPITKEKDINRILSIFRIPAYSGNETGTTIIIPYIDTKALLKDVYSDTEDQENKPFWTKRIDDYLSVALQRWYAPRILNESFAGGPYLRPSVNGKVINLNSMQPLFRCIRDLYTYATTGEKQKDFQIKEIDKLAIVDDIRIRDVLEKTSAGKFAFFKISRAQLRMDPPDNCSNPYQQITNRYFSLEEGNLPIIMYTRQPGMIVGYDYEGAWTRHMPKSDGAEYIIGIFIANSSNCLKDILHPKYDKPLTLEEYIRLGEKADHASWADWNIKGRNYQIVSKIIKGVNRKIADRFKEKPKAVVEKTNIGLSHALANMILPPINFGNAPAPVPAPKPPVPNPKPKVATGAISIDHPTYKDGAVTLDLEFSVPKGLSRLDLVLNAEYKNYCADDWENEKEVGLPFPVQFSRFTISAVKHNEKKAHWKECRIILENKPVHEGGLELSFINSLLHKKCSGISIRSSTDIKLQAECVFMSTDPSIKCSLKLQKEE